MIWIFIQKLILKMSAVKNSNVRKELEKMLAPLRKNDESEYNMIMNLIEEVYDDPKIDKSEASSFDIESKLYFWICNSVSSTNEL